MSALLAALLAGAGGAVTYVFCIRPMRHSHGHAVTGESGRDPDLNRQIADLREEIRVLRAQDCLDDARRGTRSQPPEPHG